MRCPHCAGEILDGSRFCGICGRPIEPGGAPISAPAVAVGPGRGPGPSGDPSLSPSLFELPVSRKARLAKLFAVLALDLVLAGAGVAMIVSYLGAREQAVRPPAIGADAGVETTAVEIGTPVVGAEDPHPPTASDTPAEPGTATPPPSRTARTPAPRRAPPEPARPDPEPASDSPPTAAEPAAGIDEPAAEPVDDGLVDTESDPVAPAADADREARMQLLAHRVGVVVDKNRSQFQRCYRQVAKASGPVQGKVVIRFKVGQDGRASGVRATENETKSERLAACLVAQFGSWSFPTHTEPEPIDFMWPIVFKAPG